MFFKRKKKIKHVMDRHGQCVPMMILDDQAATIAWQIWDSSISKTDIKPSFNLSDRDICYLDPGGSYFFKTPHKSFEIDDYVFDIQLSKVDQVLSSLRTAQERIPGYYRFYLWIAFFVVPSRMYYTLVQNLEELSRQDAVLHALITESEIKFSLEKNNPNIWFNIPREQKGPI